MLGLRMTVVAVALLGAHAHAHADGTQWETAVLYDGSAVPLLYVPIAANVMLRSFGEVREEPLWFHDSDLGAQHRPDTVPHWTLWGGAFVAGAAMAGDESRWFHVKGLAQTVALTGFATQALKYTFGRRRPYYQVGADNPVQARKSFPSGHASMGSAVATYTGLFLAARVLDDPDGAAAFGAYGGLAAVTLAICYSRLRDGAHHATDVIAGLVLGTAIAAAIFHYQDGRFEDAAATPTMLTLPL